LERARGNRRQAAKWLNEGLRQYHEHDDVVGMAGCLSGLATLAERNNDLERAGRLFAAAGKLSEGATAFLPPSEIASYQAAAASVQERLGSEEYYRAVATGYAMPREHLLAEAALVDGKTRRRVAPRPDPDAAPTPASLGVTEPQFEVLRLYARGMKVKDIATELFKGSSTVYQLIERMKARLGIESDGELIVFAREHGLR
jgi:DNA-binding NarL/FixJ family response regulator